MSTGWQDVWPGEFNLWSHEYQAKNHNVILIKEQKIYKYIYKYIYMQNWYQKAKNCFNFNFIKHALINLF